MILSMGEVSNPMELWQKHQHALCQDIQHNVQIQMDNQDIELSDEMKDEALIEIEDMVIRMGGLPFIGTEGDLGINLPIPNRQNRQNSLHKLVLQETVGYDKDELAHYIHENEPKLQPQQREVYEKMLSNIESGEGGIFFLDACGGTGKTFVLNLLLSKVRHSGHIALAVASSGIAATLLKGGRTSHSTFKIPLDLTDSSVCSIRKGSPEAELIIKAIFVVWDEASMTNR